VPIVADATVGPQAINRPAITACIILSVVMQALDTTIANVALPYMQGSVSASADQINWVLTSYSGPNKAIAEPRSSGV
jgi:MFS transporter, DHA2 family, multidrug resistance protein